MMVLGAVLLCEIHKPMYEWCVTSTGGEAEDLKCYAELLHSSTLGPSGLLFPPSSGGCVLLFTPWGFQPHSVSAQLFLP